MSGMPTPHERPGSEAPPPAVQGLSPGDLALLLGRGAAVEAPQSPPLPRRPAPADEGWSPRMDVFVEGDALVVLIDLPGIRKRDVRVALDRNVLVIEGEVPPGSGDAARQYYRAERQRGPFRHLLQLPPEVRAEQITAHLEHGVLELRLPQLGAPAEPQRIPVR